MTKKLANSLLQITEQNPETWNCMYSLNNEHGTLELDQFVGECLQIGSCDLKIIGKLNFIGSLN
jgi:hypothetical protein